MIYEIWQKQKHGRTNTDVELKELVYYKVGLY